MARRSLPLPPDPASSPPVPIPTPATSSWRSKGNLFSRVRSRSKSRSSTSPTLPSPLLGAFQATEVFDPSVLPSPLLAGQTSPASGFDSPRLGSAPGSTTQSMQDYSESVASSRGNGWEGQQNGEEEEDDMFYGETYGRTRDSEDDFDPVPIDMTIDRGRATRDFKRTSLSQFQLPLASRSSVFFASSTLWDALGLDAPAEATITPATGTPPVERAPYSASSVFNSTRPSNPVHSSRSIPSRPLGNTYHVPSRSDYPPFAMPDSIPESTSRRSSEQGHTDHLEQFPLPPSHVSPYPSPARSPYIAGIDIPDHDLPTPMDDLEPSSYNSSVMDRHVREMKDKFGFDSEESGAEEEGTKEDQEQLMQKLAEIVLSQSGEEMSGIGGREEGITSVAGGWRMSGVSSARSSGAAQDERDYTIKRDLSVQSILDASIGSASHYTITPTASIVLKRDTSAGSGVSTWTPPRPSTSSVQSGDEVRYSLQQFQSRASPGRLASLDSFPELADDNSPPRSRTSSYPRQYVGPTHVASTFNNAYPTHSPTGSPKRSASTSSRPPSPASSQIDSLLRKDAMGGSLVSIPEQEYQAAPIPSVLPLRFPIREPTAVVPPPPVVAPTPPAPQLQAASPSIVRKRPPPPSLLIPHTFLPPIQTNFETPYYTVPRPDEVSHFSSVTPASSTSPWVVEDAVRGDASSHSPEGMSSGWTSPQHDDNTRSPTLPFASSVSNSNASVAPPVPAPKAPSSTTRSFPLLRRRKSESILEEVFARPAARPPLPTRHTAPAPVPIEQAPVVKRKGRISSFLSSKKSDKSVKKESEAAARQDATRVLSVSPPPSASPRPSFSSTQRAISASPSPSFSPPVPIEKAELPPTPPYTGDTFGFSRASQCNARLSQFEEQLPPPSPRRLPPLSPSSASLAEPESPIVPDMMMASRTSRSSSLNPPSSDLLTPSNRPPSSTSSIHSSTRNVTSSQSSSAPYPLKPESTTPSFTIAFPTSDENTRPQTPPVDFEPLPLDSPSKSFVGTMEDVQGGQGGEVFSYGDAVVVSPPLGSGELVAVEMGEDYGEEVQVEGEDEGEDTLVIEEVATKEEESDGEDDDLPLGSMEGALGAQQTLRQASQKARRAKQLAAASVVPSTPSVPREILGHSFLPQTDEAVVRRSGSPGNVSGPPSPLDPAIARSVLMLETTPAAGRPRTDSGALSSGRSVSSPIESSASSSGRRSALSPESIVGGSRRPSLAAETPIRERRPSTVSTTPTEEIQDSVASPSLRTSPANLSVTPSSLVRQPSTATSTPSRTSPTTLIRPISRTGEVESHVIFLGDLTRSFVVKVLPTTRCGEVVAAAKGNDLLVGIGMESEGTFALWEVCTGLGLERPVREFELLADVIKSWNEDANSLVIRRSTLWPVLSAARRMAPGPFPGGFVQVEIRRGKWAKRYLQLTDGALTHSKSETSKDTVILCQLTAFDVYFVTKSRTKALNPPKGCVFALKSLLPRLHYEDSADYSYFISIKSNDELQKYVRAIIESRNVFVRTRESQVLSTHLPSSPPSPPLSSPPLPTADKRRPGQSNALRPTPAALAAPPSTTSQVTGYYRRPSANVWNGMSEGERSAWLKGVEREARIAGKSLLKFDK